MALKDHLIERLGDGERADAVNHVDAFLDWRRQAGDLAPLRRARCFF